MGGRPECRGIRLLECVPRAAGAGGTGRPSAVDAAWADLGVAIRHARRPRGNQPRTWRSQYPNARTSGSKLSPSRFWNELLFLAHRVAVARGVSPEELRRLSRAAVRIGRFEDAGYVYIEAAGVSVQRAQANRAWGSALLLAQHLRVGIEATFVRRGTDGTAAAPEPMSLSWDPSADPPDTNMEARI